MSRHVFTLYPEQAAVHASLARFRVVACGRRWGKTELGKAIAIETAEAAKTVWWLSPSYSMSVDVWRSLKASLAEEWEEKNETQKLIVLPGGGSIRVRSGDDPDSLRGASLDLAVLDEAAYLRESVWTAAIRPTLADRKGKAIFLSTPRGVGNWFYRVYSFGLDPNRPEWQAWRFPSSTNPLITPDEMAEAQRDLPERVFRAEFLAEFLDDSGSVFRGVREAATAAPGMWLSGHRYVIGVDWGRVEDFTVGVVLDATENVMVELDRFNGVGWALQRGRLAELADRWHPSLILAEANSIGGPNIDALREEGLPVEAFTTTNSSKEDLINGLALAIECADLRLLNDPVLLHELNGYGVERLTSGRLRYGAPAGGHDDTVIALALAWEAAGRGSTSLFIR